MSDTYRETSSRSWFGHIGGSFGGALFGLLLVVACVIGLFWNEGRAVTTARSLAEGAGAVIAVPSDVVDSGNEGRLVHVTGALTADAVPGDPDFGITKEGVRLVRHAEMYQWRETSRSETEKKLGGGEETVTTYSYSREWVERPIDSSDFKQPFGHSNPSMEIREKTFQVPEARLGAFILGEPVLDEIGGAETLPVASGEIDKVRAAFQGAAPVAIVNGRIHLGRNPTAPAVGDYRISYEIVPLGPVSVVARQTGSSFDAYPTRAGDKLLMAARGDVPAERMFADAVTGNTVLTWVLRAAGLLVLFIGFALVLSPIGVLADVIPLLGRLVRIGTSLVALALAAVVGAATIAVAWFWYRPLLALAILAGGVVLGALLVRFGRGSRPAAPASQAAPAT